MEEGLDLFGLVPDGGIWNFISDDSDGDRFWLKKEERLTRGSQIEMS